MTEPPFLQRIKRSNPMTMRSGASFPLGRRFSRTSSERPRELDPHLSPKGNPGPHGFLEYANPKEQLSINTQDRLSCTVLAKDRNKNPARLVISDLEIQP